MSFWNSTTLKRRAEAEKLIQPWEPARVAHGAYELAMGPEAYLTSSVTPEKKRLNAGDEVVIPPGQFALLLTEEVISMPADSIGFISIKAGVKFRGLVNVSGFHVDPGFSGRLKFSVYNAGSKDIVLLRGDPLFPIWFANLDAPTPDPYAGSHKGQMAIDSQDIMNLHGVMESPAALSKGLAKLRLDYETAFQGAEGRVNAGLASARDHGSNAKQLALVAIASIIAIVVGVGAVLLNQSSQLGELKNSLAASMRANEDTLRRVTELAQSNADLSQRLTRVTPSKESKSNKKIP